MNHIQKIREEIKNYFDPNSVLLNTKEVFISPSNNYKLETVEYHQAKEDVNWNVTKVVVYDFRTGEIIFNFFGNDGRFFHQWFTKDDMEYLICAEDLFGGQTVLNLTNKTMSSFTLDDDGFIGVNFFPSPDKNLIVIEGCYWGGPTILKVYDFKNPMQLPLTELEEIELTLNEEEFIEWIDNYRFKTIGKESLDEIEYCEGGGIRNKRIDGDTMKRIIEIKKTTPNNG